MLTSKDNLLCEGTHGVVERPLRYPISDRALAFEKGRDGKEEEEQKKGEGEKKERRVREGRKEEGIRLGRENKRDRLRK